MPRLNPDRTIGREELVARRIADFRQRHDPPMTYEDFAGRMAAVGCPIRPSAIFKIEKGEPRRKISVDELVAFAEVLDVPVEQLVARPAHDLALGAEEAVRQCRAAYEAWERALVRESQAVEETRLARRTLDVRWEKVQQVLAKLPQEVSAVYLAEMVDLDSRLRPADATVDGVEVS